MCVLRPWILVAVRPALICLPCPAAIAVAHSIAVSHVFRLYLILLSCAAGLSCLCISYLHCVVIYLADVHHMSCSSCSVLAVLMLSHVALSALSWPSALSRRCKPSQGTSLVFVSRTVYPTLLILLSVFCSCIALKRWRIALSI